MLWKILKKALAAIFFAGIGWVILLLIGWLAVGKLPIEDKGDKLRIVSMNIAVGNVLEVSVQKNLIASGADIIVLLEWNGDNILLSDFEQAGYRAVLNSPAPGVRGVCILSKPEGKASLIKSPIEIPCDFPLGQFRFQWKGETITLFAVHAPPPVSACKGTTNDYLIAMAEWLEQGRLATDVGIGKKGDITILAGDFNCISLDKGMRTLRGKGFEDSYSTFSLTAQTWRPFLRFPYVAKIDYILFSPELSSQNCGRFVIDDSDHLGLYSDFVLLTEE